jgi:hypothetical protein
MNNAPSQTVAEKIAKIGGGKVDLLIKHVLPMAMYPHRD